MEAIFLKILNLSITASWLILGAILVRFLFKKAPKSLRFVIWALVGARLLFPISPESVLSLIPSAEPIPQEILTSSTPQIHSGINAVNQFINPIISEALTPSVPQSVTGAQSVAPATPMQTLTHVASIVWICGMILMLGYALISYLILRRRVRASVLTDGGAYLCDEIDSPFVLGIIKPRIYLPSALDQKQSEHVLSHEKAHIRRRDHWWKPLSFVLLAVYWFNPLIWAAYVLLCRDIELACDERVARSMSDGERADYSSTLLELSIPRKMITACPVAFGEVSVKSRIRSVLSYKKPTLWIIIAALVACAVLAVTLFANPVKEEEKDEPKQEEKDEPIKEKKEENKPDITPEWDVKYAAADSKDAVIPYFCLNEAKKRYIFLYSGFSSHISEGSYEMIEQDLIMLEDETEKEYVFRKTEEGYSFDAAASASLPEYKYSADSEPEVCIEDGTLFVINEEVVEPYTEEGEYWIIDRSANGDYSYTILDKNKNSLLTGMIAVSKPTISYLGNDIVKVIHTEERTHSITPLTYVTYINIDTAQKAELYLSEVVTENVNNGIVVVQPGDDTIFIMNIFDREKLFYRVQLPDASPVVENLITSCVINDDTTVLIKYLSGESHTEKELQIDETALNLLYYRDGFELYTTHRDTLTDIYYTDFELRYNDKTCSFKGAGAGARCLYHTEIIASEDLTGDGVNDILVKLPQGSGTGICMYDVHIFDGKTLREYPVESIYDIVPANVKTLSDDKAYYIEFTDGKYIFNYTDIEGITTGSNIITDMWNDFGVLNGKLICDTACQVITWPLASLHTEYRFDGEKFVFGSMTIEPHEEYTIENENASAESTPDTAAPAAKPNRAPETNVNTNTNTNTNTNINNNTSTQTPAAPETSAPSSEPSDHDVSSAISYEWDAYRARYQNSDETYVEEEPKPEIEIPDYSTITDIDWNLGN